MLKTASAIASCLGLTVVAGALANPETASALGAAAPVLTGAAGFTAGLATHFGHDLCKRFRERASAYAEKVWGLDGNEHVARGVRRAQIAATRELLHRWRRPLPPDNAANDDYGHALAALLVKWCDEQDDEAAVKKGPRFTARMITAKRFAGPLRRHSAAKSMTARACRIERGRRAIWP
jgi:hypothetical protein